MPKEVNLAEVVNKVYRLILPLKSEERHRVMRSVSALFQDGSEPDEPLKAKMEVSGALFNDTMKCSPPVAVWMRRNDVTCDHLEQIFHYDGSKVSIITDEVGGDTKKEQTINCYVLEGIRALLETGIPKFSDNEALELCDRIGCRDKTNHSANRNSAGNKITGSRTDGFTLVSPGFAYAANLIKQIAISATATSNK